MTHIKTIYTHMTHIKTIEVFFCAHLNSKAVKIKLNNCRTINKWNVKLSGFLFHVEAIRNPLFFKLRSSTLNLQ